MEEAIKQMKDRTVPQRQALHFERIGEEDVWCWRFNLWTILRAVWVFLLVLTVFQFIQRLFYFNIMAFIISSVSVLVLYISYFVIRPRRLWDDINAIKGYPDELHIYSDEQPQNLEVESRGARVNAYVKIPGGHAILKRNELKEIYPVKFQHKVYNIQTTVKGTHEEDERVYYYSNESYRVELTLYWGIRTTDGRHYFVCREGLKNDQKFQEWVKSQEIPMGGEMTYQNSLPISTPQGEEEYQSILAKVNKESDDETDPV